MYLNDYFTSAPKILITQLSIDSRMPMKDAIYFCLPGMKYDGHDFIDEAINNGAVCIVYDKDIKINDKAIFIRVNNSLETLNIMANAFYGYPALNMTNYIVSGCSGKNIISHSIYHFLSNRIKTGYIGERGVIFGDFNNKTSYHTLPIIDNLIFLKRMKEDNVVSCIFESSIFNLSLKKLDSVNSKVFIYSGTIEDSEDFKLIKHNYYNLLNDYINNLDENTLLVLNNDDEYLEKYNCLHQKTITYGIHNDADVVASNITNYDHGTIFILKYDNRAYQVRTKLIGERNISYLLACVCSLLERYSIEEIISSFKDLEQIEGKIENIDLNQKYHVVIDRAVNFTQIKDIVDLASAITSSSKKLIYILSADYNIPDSFIDKYMPVLESNADQIIITISNTYGRDIGTVLANFASHIKKTPYLIIDDRETAIESAIELLNEGDSLMILGLGDSKSLYLFNEKISYEGDSAIARKYINKRMKEENELF